MRYIVGIVAALAFALVAIAPAQAQYASNRVVVVNGQHGTYQHNRFNQVVFVPTNNVFAGNSYGYNSGYQTPVVNLGTYGSTGCNTVGSYGNTFGSYGFNTFGSYGYGFNNFNRAVIVIRR